MATGPITRTAEPHSKLDPAARGSVVIRRQGLDTRHSMRSIATGAGLSPSEVSRIMNGQRTGRPQTLVKIAAVLGLTLDALYAYLTPLRPKHKR